jgi:hypothetical protein
VVFFLLLVGGRLQDRGKPLVFFYRVRNELLSSGLGMVSTRTVRCMVHGLCGELNLEQDEGGAHSHAEGQRRRGGRMGNGIFRLPMELAEFT